MDATVVSEALLTAGTGLQPKVFVVVVCRSIGRSFGRSTNSVLPGSHYLTNN